MIPVALQFYSLGKQLKEDFAGTIKRISETGYTAMEMSYGIGSPLSVKERQKILSDNGIQVCSVHIDPQTLSTKFDETIEILNTYQTKELILAWMPKEHFVSVKGCHEAGEKIAEWGARFRAQGFRFTYHNHEFDVVPIEGRSAMEWALEVSTPLDVSAEIDVYWIYLIGGDPVRDITRMGARTRFLHLKDGYKDMRNTALGRGEVDFPAIFDVCEKNGMVDWYIVEQENYEADPYGGDPYKSLRHCLDYLKSLGKA